MSIAITGAGGITDNFGIRDFQVDTADEVTKLGTVTQRGTTGNPLFDALHAPGSSCIVINTGDVYLLSEDLGWQPI